MCGKGERRKFKCDKECVFSSLEGDGKRTWVKETLTEKERGSEEYKVARKKIRTGETASKTPSPFSCIFLPSFTSWILPTEDIDQVQPARNQNFALVCCWVAGRLNFAGVPTTTTTICSNSATITVTKVRHWNMKALRNVRESATAPHLVKTRKW